MPRTAFCTADTCIAVSARLAAGIAFSSIFLLFSMLVAHALPVFLQQGVSGIFSWTWQPYQGSFGILPMMCGTLILSCVTLLCAWPVALALCCWMQIHRKGIFPALVRGCIQFMTAIPTIVYGFAAVFLLTPLLRASLGGSGLNCLAAVSMLILLTLPTLVLVMESGMRPLLEKLCPQGLALGLTRRELLWFVVLPQARKSLLAAAILGLGRAMGDTLLPLMLAGNAPQLPTALSDSVRTLTAHMALVTSNEVGGGAYNSLFAAGFLLLAINGLLAFALQRLGRQT